MTKLRQLFVLFLATTTIIAAPTFAQDPYRNDDVDPCWLRGQMVLRIDDNRVFCRDLPSGDEKDVVRLVGYKNISQIGEQSDLVNYVITVKVFDYGLKSVTIGKNYYYSESRGEITSFFLNGRQFMQWVQVWLFRVYYA